MPSNRITPDGGRRGFRPQNFFDFRNPRTLGLFLLLAALGVVLAVGQRFGTDKIEKISWADFLNKLEKGEIQTLVIRRDGGAYTGTYRGGGVAAPEGGRSPVGFIVPEDRAPIWDDLGDEGKKDFLKLCEDKQTDYTIETTSPWLLALPNILLLVLVLGAVIFFMTRYRGASGPGGVLSFGKSRAVLVTKEKIKTTFRDVAGIEEAKDEVKEIIDFLKDPRKFQRLGGRVPKGALLVGPPGCGKTLLARAIAGEAAVPFYSISGSDFVEMFVGVGASRVRDLFQQARANTPCVIFLDEIDAVGRRRGTGLGGGHDEREQTLNAILVEMDGFESDEKVIVLAATNRPDVLDPALLRPGRFDRHIYIDPPDLKGREEIFRIYARKVKLLPGLDLQALARMTPGFTGANIEAMMNEAAIMAVMRGADAVEMRDLDEARDKVKWGREKRSRVMPDDERENTALHEGGHAVCAMLSPEVEPLHKVTIVHRGSFLGATMQLPVRDEYSLGRKKLLGQMRVLYGGRVAEEILGRDMTSGAAADIGQATQIARHMVCEWGMSEKLGPIHYEQAHENVFLGYEISRPREFSEETARIIDEEVRRLAENAYAEARRLVEDNRDALLRIRDALIEREVLTRDEVDKLMRGETLPPADRLRKAAAETDEDTDWDDLDIGGTAKEARTAKDDPPSGGGDGETADPAEDADEEDDEVDSVWNDDRPRRRPED